MAIDRRRFLKLGAGSVGVSMLARYAAAIGKKPGTTTADTLPRKRPIIDVHMHAYPADMVIEKSLVNPVTGKPPQIRNGEEHLQACLAEMKRLNVAKCIVSGGTGDRLAAAAHWRDVAPDRVIAGAAVRGSEDTPLPEIGILRDAFQRGQMRVLGEVTAEYAGLTLSDRKFDPYLSLAEELEIPVSLHTGTGPPGISFDPCCRAFRVSLGNPALIEDALNRHPKLRVNLMHAGWPYLQETIAMLLVYPQVYVDVGAISWMPPRPEFHAYLGAITRAGFGERIMFGTDQMYWPEAIGMAIDAVDSAPFLTASDKEGIFSGNALRFFRLEPLSESKTS